jgi:hypothetical protein
MGGLLAISGVQVSQTRHIHSHSMSREAKTVCARPHCAAICQLDLALMINYYFALHSHLHRQHISTLTSGSPSKWPEDQRDAIATARTRLVPSSYTDF